MAKKSKIVRDVYRREVVARHAESRARFKRVIADPAATGAERSAAAAALRRQPRDASPTRLRNRDLVDGRPRAHLGAFGLSRVRFREMALRGEMPGVRKASW
jgi:small subunit ribosomal protein S14